MSWKGREAEAVQGLLAYRREHPEPIKREEAERGLMTDVLATTELDPLGIGVIVTDEQFEIERAASAAPALGPDVLWTEPVLLDHGALVPNDTFFAQQWNLAEVNAIGGWDNWNGDPHGVVLAILDTGVPIEAGRLSHTDLDDVGRISLAGDMVNNDADPADDHGHGTHVTGIAAAATNNGVGVAGLWPGDVLIAKVFNAANDGSSITFRDGVLAAVNFAKQRGARLVINYSGGGPDTRTKRETVEFARQNDALIVAAAGNESGGGIIHPAAYSTDFVNVIAVGAVDRQRRRPAFASRGPEMTVVAPGVDILSSLPNYFVTLNQLGKQTKYDRLGGTSQAAPVVAALASLVWSKRLDLTAEQVRDRITQTATPIAGSAQDFGHGIINAEAALR
ncbi:MAG TPA: S8 family serine peptidase [Pyrinomonadaceae bacterium]|jgi:thermitase